MKKNVASVSREAVEPALVSAGFTVWDVRYEKEANVWNLVFELDRGENMSMSDCEEANAIVEPIIDELDPIEGAYVLEVSSAGLTRVLRTRYHYETAVKNGWECELKLFRALSGAKELRGVITSLGEETLVISGTEIEIKNIAKATAILG